ncbi:50S ribosomal subunit protein L6 [Beggiatoa sp. PS]|nr:50S ribosomal subunit protein L6 [Beggiatoa sp. PS]
MSRVAKRPIPLPANVTVNLEPQLLVITGPHGQQQHPIHPAVQITLAEKVLTFTTRESSRLANAMAGTTRALVNNIVQGVTQGFEKKLILIGVGYRAAVQDSILNLTLGFSHPINFTIPDGITIETPNQSEIVIKGIDKQQVGQVAANIRAYRPPEPYKGKGIKYSDEIIIRKEAKKK